MKIKKTALVCMTTFIMLSGCSVAEKDSMIKMEEDQETGRQENMSDNEININENADFTAESYINDVIYDPAFDGYGRLIFPVDMEIDDSLRLKNISSILPWYSKVNTDKTVEIVNYMKNQALSGRQVFYNIYSEEEMQEDPDKRDTGLFFFRGADGEKTDNDQYNE